MSSYTEIEPSTNARRRRDIPKVTYAFNHPLIVPEARDVFKRAIIIHMSTSALDMEKARQTEKKMGPPKGGHKDWIDEGEHLISVI